MNMGLRKTYVAVDDSDGKTILGYYTLSPAQVDFSEFLKWRG